MQEQMSNGQSKYIDPVAIITIIVSFSYFLGWAYAWGYFTRLGIQFQSLNLPASYYLDKAFWGFGILTVVVIALPVIKKDFKEFQNRFLSTFRSKALAIVIFLIIFLMIPMIVGEYHAKQLIEGDEDQLFMINFSWKEKSPKDIDGKELMFIIHQEGKYYVVNKQKPAPQYPEVYIIPDEQIKFAVIKKSPFSRSHSLIKFFTKNDS